jgi:hypothetical protein
MPDMIYEYIVQIMPEPKSQKPRMKLCMLALLVQMSQLRPYINDTAHDGAQRLIPFKRLPNEIINKVLFYEEGDLRPSRDADQYNIAMTFLEELLSSRSNGEYHFVVYARGRSLGYNKEYLVRFLYDDVANIDKVNQMDPVIAALNPAMQPWWLDRDRYFFNDDNCCSRE